MNTRPVLWGVLIGWILTFAIGVITWAVNSFHNEFFRQTLPFASSPIGPNTSSQITLSNTSVPENQAIGHPVGSFATAGLNPTGTYTYTLISGAGGTDNAFFYIVTDTLHTSAVFNYQVKSRYNILVQASESLTTTATQGFTITVTNLGPVDISLDNNTITETLPLLTPVGRLTTSDPAPASVYTYTLASGPGDTDNADFVIQGDRLLTHAVFQYTAKNSYSIRIQTDDGSGGTFQKPFTIFILDLPPTDITLSNNGITKNISLIGNFSTADPSIGDTHTYSLVNGSGDGDNAYFVVVSNTLATKPGFNYRLKSNFNIRVRSTDSGGLYVEKPFSLYSINQVPKALNDSYAMRTGATLSITVTGALNNSCPATQAPNVTDVITETGVLNNDCDPDQDMLTAVRDSLPLHANNFNLHPDGTFTYTPAKGFVGTDSFSYHATDGLANSNTAEVEITVLDLESPKVFWQTPVINGEVFVASNNLQEIIPLSVDATDNIAVDHVRFYRWDAINNKYLDIVNVSSPPYQAELAVKTLNAGWNQIFVKAEDSSGNWSNRAWIWVLVNRTFLPTAIH